MKSIVFAISILAATLVVPPGLAAPPCATFVSVESLIGGQWTDPAFVCEQVAGKVVAASGTDTRLITPGAAAIRIVYEHDIPGYPFDIYGQLDGLGWDGEKFRMILDTHSGFITRYVSDAIPIDGSGTLDVTVYLPGGARATTTYFAA